MEIVYEADRILLLHGDCRSGEAQALIAARIGTSPATLVTDPPYGISHFGRQSTKWHQPIAGDENLEARDEILAWWGDRPAVIFGSWKRPHPAGTRAKLIWDKRGIGGMGPTDLPWKPDHEEIYILGNGFTGQRGSSILTGETICSWNTGPCARRHPNEKPVQLMQRLIDKAPGIIVDPFAGSGATLLAARNLGRPAIGVEIDRDHIDTILGRLAELTLPIQTTIE